MTLSDILRDIQQRNDPDEIDFIKSVLMVISLDFDSVQNLLPIEYTLTFERAAEIIKPLGLTLISGKSSDYITWARHNSIDNNK